MSLLRKLLIPIKGIIRKKVPDFIKQNKIPLGWGSQRSLIYKIHNKLREVVLVVAPPRTGKTNVIKRIMAYEMKYYRAIERRRFIVLDGKGIDWETIKFANKRKDNLIKEIDETVFPIEDVQVYVPCYDIDLAKKGDIPFGFSMLDCTYEDWETLGITEAGAWALFGIKNFKPELFEDPDALIDYISKMPENGKQLEYDKSGEYITYIDSRTKTCIRRQFKIFVDHGVFVDKNSEQYIDFAEVLKKGIIPVIKFTQESERIFVKFYAGKILQGLYKARERDYNLNLNEIGNVTVIVEEADLFIPVKANFMKNKAADAIRKMIKQGGTQGWTIYLITSDLENINSVATKSAVLIIGANLGKKDKEVISKLVQREDLQRKIFTLKLDKTRNIRNFALVPEGRDQVFRFNPARCPIGATEER